MADLRTYILSLTAAAMICGVLSGFLHDGSTKLLIRFILGMFLTLAVIRPFAKVPLPQLEDIFPQVDRLSQEAVEQGEKMVQGALEDIIKARTEAYILEKADQLNADVRAEVTVSRDGIPVPVAASIQGSWTPYARDQLQLFLDTELGIPKENLQWNGER